MEWVDAATLGATDPADRSGEALGDNVALEPALGVDVPEGFWLPFASGFARDEQPAIATMISSTARRFMLLERTWRC